MQTLKSSMNRNWLLALFALSFTSCAHPSPKEWWPSTHKDMMGECQGMCKGKVESYEAWTASCKCKQ